MSNPSEFDVIIIGAGMSGLSAGIRAAYFDRRVCLVERHEQFGGLNSFYRLNGRQFDVGLHAMTNYVPVGVRNAPLPKLLRQLRLSRADWDLRPQKYSEVRFGEQRLRFGNDIELLRSEIARAFPDRIDAFRRLVRDIRAFDDTRLDATPTSARRVLRDTLSNPILTDMLLCPLMYYGSADEHDMDFTQFVTMFKSIFLEGFARPRIGVRRIVASLVRRYRACGGTLRMRCGVDRLEVVANRVERVVLESGEVLAAPIVLSSAGYFETMALCSDAPPGPPPGDGVPGRLSFVESIYVLDTAPADLGIGAAVTFFNDAPTFTYARPEELVDVRSGVICCPNNFEGHDDLPEGVIRFTSLADFDRWVHLSDADYARAKADTRRHVVSRALRFIPEFRDHVVATDTFTPRTIRKYTGHINGAVYGAPRKRRDGRTRLRNLFICGTDQGFLGIIGACLSGITIANLYVLSES